MVSTRMHQNLAARPGVIERVVVVNQVSKAIRQSFQRVVHQSGPRFPCYTTSADEPYSRILEAVEVQELPQYTHIKRGIVSHDNVLGYNLADLRPYFVELGFSSNDLTCNTMNLDVVGAKVSQMLGRRNKPRQLFGNFPVFEEYKPNGTNARPLLVCGLEIQGNKVDTHANGLHVRFRSAQDIVRPSDLQA